MSQTTWCLIRVVVYVVKIRTNTIENTSSRLHFQAIALQGSDTAASRSHLYSNKSYDVQKI